MSTHTPGPWTCDERGYIRDEDGRIIAQASSLGDTDEKVEESVENGLLLAAAPDLRDLLIEALEELDIEGNTVHADIYRRACTAICGRPLSPEEILA